MAMNRGRLVRWAASIVGVVSGLGIAVLLVVLFAPVLPRFDVTSTGRLALAPRTLAVLAEAPPETRVVLAADLSSGRYSPASVRRVLDILDEFERAGRSLEVTSIDTGSIDGRARFEGFIRSMLDRDQGEIAAAVSKAEDLAQTLDAMEGTLTRYASGIDDLRGRAAAPSTADALAPRASQCRATAEQIPAMTAAVRSLLERTIGERTAPDLPQARSLLVDSVASIRTLLRVIAEDLATRAAAQAFDAEGAERAASLARVMTSQSDALGASVAGLEAQQLPAVIRAVAALEASEALLVLGPPGTGVNAVGLDDLIPQQTPGAPAIDAGRTAEALLTNALATLGDSARPVVVITHASPRRILRSDGDGILAALQRRSGLRGIEWLEWPVLLDQEPPSAIARAKAEARPVIFSVIGVDTAASGGADRAERTAAVTTALIQTGERVLLNLAPSTLPGMGEADPMAEPLNLLGLRADTGRPVLRERQRGNDRLVDWEITLVPGDSDSPLGAVVTGLATLIPWPMVIEPIEADEQAHALSPILTLSGVEGVWREGEWLGYWVTNPQQRPLLRDKPAPGGTRDATAADAAIAWSIESAERSRAVVIGSHIWMFDQASDRPAVIDGRLVQTSPGNAELFLAAIEWLAGNDGMLAPSASAMSTPTVQPIEAGRLSVIRWSLVAGLPLVTLMMGIAFRVLRG